MTKQQPEPAVPAWRAAYRVAGSLKPPDQDSPVKCPGLPAEFIVSGESASRMEPIASPTCGSDATPASRDSAVGETIASELTKARYSPPASAAPRSQPPEKPVLVSGVMTRTRSRPFTRPIASEGQPLST